MEYVLRYDVEPKRTAAFRSWLAENEEAIAAHTPEGWTYRGTFFTVRGFGEYTNETRWEIEGYAALGSGFNDEESIRTTKEWMDFVDQTRQFQATLYKTAAEVDFLPGS